MDRRENRTIVVTSLFWKMFESVGAQIIQFIVSTIIARLLSPNLYGTIALVASFIAIIQVFIQSGLGTALIQKKEIDNLDYSSVFYFNIAFSILFYIVLFLIAPLLGIYYQDVTLSPVLRVLGISILFSGVNGVQSAYISRNMKFKELFKRTIISLSISGIVGIACAYSGLGIWSLVLQQLTQYFLITVIMWFSLKWRPVRQFSWERIGVLFSFGSKLLASSLINTLYNNARTLIIGKLYSPTDLGLYNKGEQIPRLITSGIDGSVQAVMLPALSANQENKHRVKMMLRRSMKTSSFVMFPIMIGLSITADSIVHILLTDKWNAIIPYVRIFCFAYLFMPLNTANLQAINAIGRSDVFLKLEVFKKVIGIIVLVITVPIGVTAIAVGSIITGTLFTVVNAYPNKRLLQYSLMEQLLDILPALSLSICMGAIILPFRLLFTPSWVLLLVQVLVGLVFYILVSKTTSMESFDYLHQLLKLYIGRDNKKQSSPASEKE